MLLALMGQGLTSKLGTDCHVVVGHFTSVCGQPAARSYQSLGYTVRSPLDV